MNTTEQDKLLNSLKVELCDRDCQNMIKKKDYCYSCHSMCRKFRIDRKRGLVMIDQDIDPDYNVCQGCEKIINKYKRDSMKFIDYKSKDIDLKSYVDSLHERIQALEEIVERLDKKDKKREKLKRQMEEYEDSD